MKVLQIISSLKTEHSYSTKLSDAIIEKLSANNSEINLVRRDLTESALPHFTEGHLKVLVNSEDVDPVIKAETLRLPDQLIAELLEADTLVIGVPMYNFAIPSILKSWVDFVARAGKTFRYTPEGAIGLAGNKKVYLAISTGAIFSEGHLKAFDFTESYMRAVLGFMGITDIETFRVEGSAIPGIKERAFETALEKLTSFYVSEGIDENITV